MKTEVNKVYDPAVGSGSLLLKFAKILGKDNVRNGFFGQEINITTYNLCRINMFLHDIGYDKFSIEHGDTLTDPKHWDEEPFEAIVSNPPYSIKWEGSDNGTLINDPRFLLPVYWLLNQKRTLLLLCIVLAGLLQTERRLLFVFPALCIVAAQNRKSENT